MDFAYTTLDGSGRENRGVLAAADDAEALARLRGRGLIVTELTPCKRKAARSSRKRGKLTVQDIYGLSREVATLLRSGMRIDRALELLRESARKESLSELLTTVLSGIKSGGDVASAFGKTNQFSPFLVSMIQVNEVAGNLQAAFENIAQYLKFQIAFRAEIRNAMTYPLFLVCSSIITLWAIFQFVVPRFFSIFGTDTASLPPAAKLLYNLSGLFSIYSLLALVGLGVVLFLGRRYLPKQVRLPDLALHLIHLPGLGTLIINLETSRFCYSMYSMLSSGVEFLRSLSLSISLIQNSAFREAMQPAVAQITEGRKIADALSEVPFLPELVTNMVRVGEEGSDLENIFLELYTMFEERFRNSVKRLLTLVEPMIILAMGLVVGFIVITLIMTVMSISNITL